MSRHAVNHMFVGQLQHQEQIIVGQGSYVRERIPALRVIWLYSLRRRLFGGSARSLLRLPAHFQWLPQVTVVFQFLVRSPLRTL